MFRDVNNGYRGLFIIFSAFMIQFIAFGIGLSIGVYNVEFLDYWSGDVMSVSLVAAINTGCFLGAGPLTSFLMWKLEHRTIVMIGAVMSTVGILPLPFLPSLQYYYVFYGVLAGLGFCFVYVPSHVMSGLYYDKHRSLATGVTTAGSGLGSTVMPIFIAYLIEEYSWKGSLLLVAGMCFNLLVFGALLLPLPSKTIPEASAEESKAMLKTPVQQICIEKNNKVSLNESEHFIHTETKSSSENCDVMEKKNTVTIESEESNKTLKDTQSGRFLMIFCDFSFDIFFVNNMLWNTGIMMVLSFAPEFFISRDFNKMNSAFMVSMFGLGTFVGCVLGGLIGNFKWVNRMHFYTVICLLFGFPVVMLPFLPSNYLLFVIFMFLFGLFFGMVLGLLVILTSDLLGPERIGDGLGFLMLSNGIGCFLGPVIAGFLRELMGNFDSVMIAAGLICFASGLLFLLIPLQAKLCQDKPKCWRQ